MGGGQNGSTAVLAACALLLAGCSGDKLLPSANTNAAAFQSYEQVETAYAAVVPGATTTADLAKIGFDVKTTPNIEILSYVGVLERLPEAARTTGHFPAAVQTCMDAQDRCTAYLFRSERAQSRHVGNAFLDLTGFERKTVQSGWSAEVVLLVQEDRVIYKIMNGRPHMEDARSSTQPLGPLQNLGDKATGKSSEKDE